jgi:EAL domain-containing protein (putative c-di-GMP-specific phosphodiesterase class I)
MNIAMDDFGTGHSSLSQLKLLPISKLKIDRSFVRDLPDDNHNAAIVKAIVLMAHTLGLQVVAEGVETTAQRHLLCETGCDLLQGFLLGEPVPAEEITRRLESGHLRVRETQNHH